jgi:hypothetical protein
MTDVRLSRLGLWSMLSPWIRRRLVWYKFTDISEECNTYSLQCRRAASSLTWLTFSPEDGRITSHLNVSDLRDHTTWQYWEVLYWQAISRNSVQFVFSSILHYVTFQKIRACCIHKQLTEITFSLFLQSVSACNRYAFMVIRPCEQCAMIMLVISWSCALTVTLLI